MQPDFSIVLPYLDPRKDEFSRALNSVAQQQTSSVTIEIVAVDDGSNPNCAADANHLLSELKAPVVRIKHDRNLGLAAARNSGLAAATGEYLIFLDADDWVHNGALATLKNHLAQHPADVTYSLTTLERGAPQRSGVYAPSDTAIMSAFSDRDNKAAAPVKMPVLALAMSSWAHVYRRQFVESATLRFDPVLRRWEDRPFVLDSQIAAGHVGFCPVALHAYQVTAGTGSITRRRYDRRDILMMSRHLRNVHKNLAISPQLAHSAFAAQHLWQSVSRFYAVVGSALAPVFFTDTKARCLALGTAGILSRAAHALIESAGGLDAPHPALSLSRLPVFVRAYLVWSLDVGDSRTKSANLWLMMTIIAVARRLRRR